MGIGLDWLRVGEDKLVSLWCVSLVSLYCLPLTQGKQQQGKYEREKTDGTQLTNRGPVPKNYTLFGNTQGVPKFCFVPLPVQNSVLGFLHLHEMIDFPFRLLCSNLNLIMGNRVVPNE